MLIILAAKTNSDKWRMLLLYIQNKGVEVYLAGAAASNMAPK